MNKGDMFKKQLLAKKGHFSILFKYLRLSRYKSQTTLASFINLFRHQWPTSEGNTHRDHFNIFI